MNQIPLQHQASTFTAFRVIVVCEAIVFLFAATLHTGAFGVPSLFAAMIVEGLCGIGCVLSAYAVFTHKSWAKKTAIIVQVLILAGVLLGVAVLARNVGIRTPINVGLHIVMLVLIVVGLFLLALPGTREGFSNSFALYDPEREG
ncbi:MAG: hypothetical protein ACYDER_26180 [Ktedonobacteraceae bacterium]